MKLTPLRSARRLAPVLLALSAACRSDSAPPTKLPVAQPATQPAAAARYAGSAACVACHKSQHDEWQTSHHALAQRPLDPARDREAFEPAREIKHGTQTSTAQMRDGRYVLHTLGPDDKLAGFEPVGVLAYDPLRQYLIPLPGGRLQVTELAFDPNKKDWFDVYGNEDRKPREWGHWTGRGMNWNSMCGVCHTTAFEKNYDTAADAYHSTYQEMGVGCEACHGPMQAHVEWQQQHRDPSASQNQVGRAPPTSRGSVVATHHGPNEEVGNAHPTNLGTQKADPTIHAMQWPDYFDTCIACHSRRGDMTGRFRAGDHFSDHYELILPDLTDAFYPDGQVRDEDFEGGPFSMSYMHAQGIRCIDCHGPHTAAPNVRSNLLCLRCHENGIVSKETSKLSKIPINEAAHGHHPLGQPGSLCFDCHMPQTTYMQRHWRRDHGMTIPDPLLTKEHGIPNACNRCHTDKSVDWALAAVQKWYGPRMDRPSRMRAQLLARLKKSDLSAAPGVLELLGKEANPAWRAVEARFLANAIQYPQLQGNIVPAMTKLLADPSPLPQIAAIETLENVFDSQLMPSLAEQAVAGLNRSLASPTRLVRLKAGWALRRQQPWEAANATADARKAHDELLDMLRCNEDQPLGAFRWAIYLADTGKPEQSVAWYEKAIRWDPGAAAFRHSYAMTLDALSRPKDALLQAARAAELEPDQAMHSYALGLLYAELGQLPESRSALQSAAARDPNQPRFWYNLALADTKLGQIQEAIDAIKKAEALEPDNADFPYVLATILAQSSQIDEVRQALERALKIDPQHANARSMLEQLNHAAK